MFSNTQQNPKANISEKIHQGYRKLLLKKDVASENTRNELKSTLKDDDVKLFNLIESSFPEMEESLKNEFLLIPMPEDEYESAKVDFSRYYIKELFPETIYSLYNFEYDESSFNDADIEEYSLGLLLLIEVYLNLKL